jgi:hypothetical protein
MEEQNAKSKYQTAFLYFDLFAVFVFIQSVSSRNIIAIKICGDGAIGFGE